MDTPELEQSSLEQWAQATYKDYPQVQLDVVIAFVRLNQLFAQPTQNLTQMTIPQVREHVMRLLDKLHVLEASFNDRTE